MALTTFDQTQLASNIPISKVVGTTTNDSAAAGYIGEYVEALVTALTNSPSSGTFGDATSISLTAGDWDVVGFIYEESGTAPTQLRAGISTTSGNSSTGLTESVNYSFLGASAEANSRTTNVPSYRMSLNSTTTVYLKILSVYGGGTPQYKCRLSARRVR